MPQTLGDCYSSCFSFCFCCEEPSIQKDICWICDLCPMRADLPCKESVYNVARRITRLSLTGPHEPKSQVNSPTTHPPPTPTRLSVKIQHQVAITLPWTP